MIEATGRFSLLSGTLRSCVAHASFHLADRPRVPGLRLSGHSGSRLSQLVGGGLYAPPSSPARFLADLQRRDRYITSVWARPSAPDIQSLARPRFTLSRVPVEEADALAPRKGRPSGRVAEVREERQASNATRWPAEPARHRPGSRRERGAQQRLEVRDAMPVRAARRRQRAMCRWPPATIPAGARCRPPGASCDRAWRAAPGDRRSRLELDDEQRAGGGVPGQKVDPATFTVDRERDLRRNLPAQLAQPGADGGAELVVARVQQSIEFAAAPARNEVDPHVEHGGRPCAAIGV